MRRSREDYLDLFRIEARGILVRLREGLEVGDPSAVRGLRQELHTLKGSARTVGEDAAASLAHELETALASELKADRLEAPSRARLARQLDRLEAEITGVPLPGGPGDAVAAFPPAEPDSPGSPGPPRAVAVALDALDRLLGLSGDLLVHHRRLLARVARGREALALLEALGSATLEPGDQARQAEEIARWIRSLGADLAEATPLFEEVRETTSELRLQPIGPLFEALATEASRLATRLGKDVRIERRGELQQVDRSVIESLRPLLVHAVTNALVHGIETPELRTAAGKPASGTVSLTASTDGTMVAVEVADDGAGFDTAALREAAVARGLLGREAAEALHGPALLEMVLSPGLSTARVVSDLAGRGVGLDAVRARVDKLQGTMTIDSEKGLGTRVTLQVPARVGVIQGLPVEASGERLVLPLVKVRGVSRELPPDPGIPVATLSELLGWDPAPPGDQASGDRSAWITIEDQGQEVALRVEAVGGEIESVQKPPHVLIGSRPYVSGVTLLEDGRPGLVLSAAELVRSVREHSSRT